LDKSYKSRHQILDRLEIYFALSGSIVAAVLTYFLVDGGQILSLFSSTGQSVASVVMVSGFAVTYMINLFAIRYADIISREENRNWRVLKSFIIATGIQDIIWSIFLATMAILNQAFLGNQINLFYTIIFSIVTVFIMVQISIDIIIMLNSRNLLRMSLLIVLIGIAYSIASVNNVDWWRENLSYVGVDTGSRFEFTLTLVIAGALMALYSLEFSKIMYKLSQKKYISGFTSNLVKINLLASAVGIAFVGIFPSIQDSISVLIHQIGAVTIIVAFFVGATTLPLLIKNIKGQFKVLSLVLLAFVIILIVLYYPLRYLNFTEMELLCYGSIGIWLLYLDKYMRKLDPMAGEI
jgi:hypothetical protein